MPAASLHRLILSYVSTGSMLSQVCSWIRHLTRNRRPFPLGRVFKKTISRKRSRRIYSPLKRRNIVILPGNIAAIRLRMLGFYTTRRRHEIDSLRLD